MRPTKESARPCPNCSASIPRQNYHTYMKRCRTCWKVLCGQCTFENRCFECFMHHNDDMVKAEYYMEKYGHVKGLPSRGAIG